MKDTQTKITHVLTVENIARTIWQKTIIQSKVEPVSEEEVWQTKAWTNKM